MHTGHEIRKILSRLYPNRADSIYAQLNQLVSKQTPQKLVSRPSAKEVYMYVAYPDSFQGQLSPLSNLTTQLERIRLLGFNALHILPFLSSPGLDRGFDVDNFLKLDPRWGSEKELHLLISEAKRLGLDLFMDLILNHVSTRHVWARKAESGQVTYQNYFLTRKQRPVLKRLDLNETPKAIYLEPDGLKSADIVFPERCGPIPHWLKLGDLWYYHTFLPEQLDLNWDNPDVLKEFIPIVIYWASLGFNFRLDAVPYLAKRPYKQTDIHWTRAHLLIRLFKLITELVNPTSLFLIESYEAPEISTAYLGKNYAQAELLYNFPLSTGLWQAFSSSKAAYLWENLQFMEKYAKPQVWMNFLRNHDELSLAYLTKTERSILQKKLLPFGRKFREDFGIVGRSFSLVGGNQQLLIFMYSMLLSLPGNFALLYGDELAKANNQGKNDLREVNRGQVLSKDLHVGLAEIISAKLNRLIYLRREFASYFKIYPVRLVTTPNHPEVFACRYKKGNSILDIVANLGEKSLNFGTFELEPHTLLWINNGKAIRI